MARLSSLAIVPCLVLGVGCSGSGSDDAATDDATEGDSDGSEADTAESEGETGDELRPNWHQDIAALVTTNCQGCHIEGGIAPFSMMSYQQSAPWATLMASQMETGLMPPWHALETDVCDPFLGYKHDARMSAEDIALVRDWADLGAPEGDPEFAEPLPDPQDLDLAAPTTTVTTDASLDISIQGQTRDFFHCLSIDPGNTEDVYLDGIQVIAGNREIVHHVLVYVDEAAESASWPGGVLEDCGGGAGGIAAPLVSGWVPGGLPMEPPDGVGIPVPAGSRLIMNVHYHALAAPTNDTGTGLALRWTNEPPEFVSLFQLIGAPGLGTSLTGGFSIPAEATGHVEEFEWVVSYGGLPFPDTVEVRLWAIANHMHKVGVDMRVWIDSAESGEACLLHTPEWDFNWQRVYEYDVAIEAGLRVRAGDTIHVRCEYDNTLDNPALAKALAEIGEAAPIDVQLGEGTLDEMCLAGVGVGIKGLP